MSATAEQNVLIKERLFEFITKHIPTANLNVIDDIVIAYVVSILDEASQDPCFDLEGFMEMMAAYIPEFADIEPGLVCSWVLELEAELSQRDESDNSSSSDSKLEYNIEHLTDMLPDITKNHRSRTNSETMEIAMEKEHCAFIDSIEYMHQCTMLLEMFPNTSTMEIKHCVSIADGDLERAAATLLHRREHGQALEAAALCAARPPPPRCDDQELKTRIIARYSYVDKNSDLKEHKPLAPKFEPKKMVRYRDNKIVSLKGERYTEVPKAGVDEENLKKPKKQHCP